MNKSLRDEVAHLLDRHACTAMASKFIYRELRTILDRHPPTDVVSVPRDLLADLRDLANDAVIHHHAAMAGHEPDVHAENDRIIEQADAILSEGKA